MCVCVFETLIKSIGVTELLCGSIHLLPDPLEMAFWFHGMPNGTFETCFNKRLLW